MAAPLISLFSGTVPSRIGQTKAEFSANINDWVSYYDVSIPEINTSVTFVNDTAIATDALAQSTANLANTIITAANFQGEWDNLTGSLAIGSTLYHDGLYWQSLIAIADVTLSEPSLVNTDYALSAQSGDYVVIQSPFTLTISGRYYVLGSDTVTIPDPTLWPDGKAFDFSRQPSEEPTISVGAGLVTTRLGLTDGIIMGVSQTTFIVKDGLYEV